MSFEWHDVGCRCHAQPHAAAAAGFETVVVVAATGGSGADVDADAGAVGAVGERTAPVAVETGIGSTQQDAACGRVGPGRHTQGATALAAPSHLMRKRRRIVTEGATLEQKDTHVHTHLGNLFPLDSTQHCDIHILILSLSTSYAPICNPVKSLWII